MKKIKSYAKTTGEIADELDAPFFDDALLIESPGSIERYAVALRKQESVKKVAESGMKTIKFNVDSALYERLKEIYDRAGFKYIERGGSNSFKTAELSAALSYFLLINSDDLCFGTLFGYKSYLYGMHSIIQFRKNEIAEGNVSVCKFLNKRKYKFFTKRTYKTQQGDKWDEDNIKIFFESSGVVDVISTLVPVKKSSRRDMK
ncbi:hypothetical protein M2I79_20330 [Aeromonas hydrophila]|uniref:hypothetical protein n=1 Tax=Aeromonas hydrophila TaxID=644 RepID=UPI0020B31A8A|nr:hypothetical protein [Aeromonas hydrophila]WEF01454.1 hypothetical protein M2I79_20330 [Aeromonas hydrophila]CAD7556805.1 hypothetical protein KBAHV01_39280 [Aeromonas hydrophila]